MATKLTLRIDEGLLQRAKSYSKKTGKSVSQIVADYFSLLTQENKEGAQLHAPLTQSLKGVLREAKISKTDYECCLEKKYL